MTRSAPPAASSRAVPTAGSRSPTRAPVTTRTGPPVSKLDWSSTACCAVAECDRASDPIETASRTRSTVPDWLAIRRDSCHPPQATSRPARSLVSRATWPESIGSSRRQSTAVPATTSAGAAIVSGSATVEPALSYRRSWTTPRTLMPDEDDVEPRGAQHPQHPCRPAATRPGHRRGPGPTRNVVATTTTVARTAMTSTDTQGRAPREEPVASSRSDSPAPRATARARRGPARREPSEPTATTASASARASDVRRAVEAPRVRRRRVSGSRRAARRAAATTRLEVPRTMRRTVGARSAARTRASDTVARSTTSGSRVETRPSRSTRSVAAWAPVVPMPARRWSRSTTPSSRASKASELRPAQPLDLRGPPPAHRRGPAELAVEGTRAEDERAVRREVGAQDAAQPERVVGPEALVDAGRGEDAADDDVQRGRLAVDEVGEARPGRRPTARGPARRSRGRRPRPVRPRLRAPAGGAVREGALDDAGPVGEPVEVGEEDPVGVGAADDPPGRGRAGAGQGGRSPVGDGGADLRVDGGELPGPQAGGHDDPALVGRDAELGAHPRVGDPDREQLERRDDEHRGEHGGRHGDECGRVCSHATQQERPHTTPPSPDVARTGPP